MLLRRWIKEAETVGWLVDRTTGRVLHLKCSKQGCLGRLVLPLESLGPTPAPCKLPHKDQYAGPVFDDYRKLVSELVRRRRSLGLSQEDANGAAGMADGHINKLEAFARVAQFPTMQLWASTLGVEITIRPAALPGATIRAIEHRPADLKANQYTQKVLFDGT